MVFLWRKTAPGSLVPLLATLTLNGPMRSAFGEGSRAAATAAWKAANPAGSAAAIVSPQTAHWRVIGAQESLANV